MRRHTRIKAQALLFEPAQIGHAIKAKARDACLADGALHFFGQVARHGLGRVTKTGFLLVGRAAPGIDHAAGQGAGAAAFKTVDHQNTSAVAARLNGGASPRSTPADDEYVRAFAPVQMLRALNHQRGLHRGDGGVARAGAHTALSSKSVRCRLMLCPRRCATARSANVIAGPSVEPAPG